MKENEKNLRKKIFRQVEEYYKKFHKKELFVPGKSLIKYSGRVFDEKEMINLVDSALDFWLTSGKYCKQFEESLGDYLGVKYVMLVNSGSSANLLAISALRSRKLGDKRLKGGDEVITTACGFPTTLNSIIQNNLVPVVVDIKLGTYNIDVSKIERSISKKTKAIFIAHTLGNPADLGRILRISKKYKLWLIEDNCDALGSEYKGKYTGTFGHISTFSFYPPHHITMGEGGAVATNNQCLKRIVSSLRDWGKDCWCNSGQDNACRNRFSYQMGRLPYGYDHKYIYSHIGYNLKATEMQAAVGLGQMGKLKDFVTKRRRNFNMLFKCLENYKDYFILPKVELHSAPSWFGFPLLVKKKSPFTRRDIVVYLEKHKIMTRMLFGGNLLKQPAYSSIKYRRIDTLKNTDNVMNNLFWIGVYPGISKKQINYISDVFSKFIQSVPR